MTAPISQRTGSQFARIMSTGSYRPERIVTNDEVCEWIDSTDEWIRDRSGIIERRFAREDETVADMACEAGRVAIERSGIAPESISMVMVANVTHPYPTPSVAAEVAYRLGASEAGAIDIGAACAGFAYGVGMSNDLVRGGSAEYVLVIGVEKLSDWVSREDRSTTFLFADGAGAVVIGPSDIPAIGPTIWGSDGSQLDAIAMTGSLTEFRDQGNIPFPTLTMKGQQVFRWAVGEMSKAAQEALDAAGVAAADLDAFIPHQANARITDAMARALKIPEHVPVARDIAYTGNTSAASIPIAMDRMLQDGEVPHGGTALLIGFGAGLVYASQVVTLP